MICKKPWNGYPCGQCMPCRINKRRLWTHRLILEGHKHAEKCVVTLTYSEAFGPLSNSLRPRQVQRWLKRLRERAQQQLRFFLCGEYGDENGRPHYHLVLYGLGLPLEHVNDYRCKCSTCSLVRDTWGLGFVYVDHLTWESAAYVCGYVTKKMTSSQDPRLGNRHPEFVRMSLRPGIGASAMQDVANSLNDAPGARAVSALGDVPLILQHGPKKFPLGRYLRRRLRHEMGAEDLREPDSARKVKATQLRALSEAIGTAQARKKLKLDIEHERIRQIETRERIWRKKGTI